MRHEEFRRALETGDVRLCRRMWSAWFPNMPAPKTAEEAEISMHMARTLSETITFKARAWSHRWLTERGLPSQMPDRLRPSAERLYPRVAEGVGISVNARNPYLKPAMLEVRQAMSDAVEDCYANGDTAPAIVRPRMFEAREKTMKALFGGIARAAS